MFILGVLLGIIGGVIAVGFLLYAGICTAIAAGLNW